MKLLLVLKAEKTTERKKPIMRRLTKRILSGILAVIMLSATAYTCGKGTDSIHAEEYDERQEYIEQQIFEETEDSYDNAASSDEIPVYRLYNPNSGEHFYTIHSNEKDSAVAAGWRYEGVGWYAPASSKEPVYRLFNPNSRDAGSHHYTMQLGEAQILSQKGWNFEGEAWWGL